MLHFVNSDFIALSRQFGSFQKRKMLMNRVAVRALELILCRLRAMLQAYLFKHLACLQEPSKTDLKPMMMMMMMMMMMTHLRPILDHPNRYNE